MQHIALFSRKKNASLESTLAEFIAPRICRYDRTRAPHFFTQVLGCETCRITEQILNEVASLGAKMDPISKILQDAETIAVVGLSNNPDRPSHQVAHYLQESGYRIIPVNPNETQVLGERAYPDLLAIPERVDIVDIFRRPEHIPEIVAQAIAKNVRVVWMQPGTENYDAADMAEAAGLKTVVGMCLRVQHKRAST